MPRLCLGPCCCLFATWPRPERRMRTAVQLSDTKAAWVPTHQSQGLGGSRHTGPGRRSDDRRGSPWETRNIAYSSLPQRQTEGRLLLQVSTGSPESYFWFPGKGHCCLFIYRLYFWMGVG